MESHVGTSQTQERRNNGELTVQLNNLFLVPQTRLEQNFTATENTNDICIFLTVEQFETLTAGGNANGNANGCRFFTARVDEFDKKKDLKSVLDLYENIRTTFEHYQLMLKKADETLHYVNDTLRGAIIKRKKETEMLQKRYAALIEARIKQKSSIDENRKLEENSSTLEKKQKPVKNSSKSVKPRQLMNFIFCAVTGWIILNKRFGISFGP